MQVCTAVNMSDKDVKNRTYNGWVRRREEMRRLVSHDKENSDVK